MIVARIPILSFLVGMQTKNAMYDRCNFSEEYIVVLKWLLETMPMGVR